jgi:GAF domain-containing protein/sugar diacid utilization regulator
VKERSERTAERLQNWLKALAHVGAAVNQGISLNELLNLVARTASDLMGYDFCSVTVPDSTGTFLVISGSHGLSDDYIQDVNAIHPIRLQGMALPSPSTQAFKLGIPIQVEDAATNPSFGPWAQAAQHQGFTSMIAVPLNTPSGTLGTLNCFTRFAHPFNGEEISLLTVLADQASIAISTAGLRAEQARTIAELKSLNETLEEQYALQRQAAEIHDRLTSLALGGGGIAEVGTALAELLGRAVVVRNDQETVVCGSMFDAGTLLEGLDRVTDGTQSTSRQGAAMRGTIDVELSLPNGSSISTVRTPVVIKEDVVSWIWTMGPLAELTPSDRHAIEHAATVMSLEFLHALSEAESVWYRSGELLSNLLKGPGPVAPALLAQAQRFGHDLSEPHAMLVTRPDRITESEVRSRLAATVARLAGNYGPRPLIGVHQDFVVTLVALGLERLESVRGISEEIRQGLIDGEPGPLAALMGPLTDASEYVGAFRTASGAVELARLRGMSGQTLMLTDLGAAEFFLQVPDTSRLRLYCEEVLGPLHRYDTHHGAALVQTLSMLVRCDLDARATAAQLQVQTATVTRRRKLIEELIGRKLTSVASLTHLATALQLEEAVTARNIQASAAPSGPAS